MPQTFQIDITTKLHRVMRLVSHRLVLLGCLRRGSSEVNEMTQKAFKNVYTRTNKHLNSIAPQVIHSIDKSLETIDFHSTADAFDDDHMASIHESYVPICPLSELLPLLELDSTQVPSNA